MQNKPSNPKDALGVSKAPMSTVSAAVLAEIGVAMLEGAAKYGKFNYRAVGVRSSVYYDAAQRHLMAWWEGEDLDPDSSMSHITKCITTLVVLRDAMIQSMVEDDRPPRSADFYQRLNELAAQIIAKHADKSPVHYTQKRLETVPAPTPNQVAFREHHGIGPVRCVAVQISDQMACQTCHTAWDMNDPHPPACPRGGK